MIIMVAVFEACVREMFRPNGMMFLHSLGRERSARIQTSKDRFGRASARHEKDTGFRQRWQRAPPGRLRKSSSTGPRQRYGSFPPRMCPAGVQGFRI